MKRYLLVGAMGILSVGQVQSTNPLEKEIANDIGLGVRIAKKLGVRDTTETVLSLALGGAALVNFIDLCSTGEKLALLKKALTGEITGRPRNIILARLGGSLLAVAAALSINHYRPIMRYKIKNQDKGLGKKLGEKSLDYINAHGGLQGGGALAIGLLAMNEMSDEQKARVQQAALQPQMGLADRE